MKKILIATASLTLMCGAAFAQGTGPAAQGDNMNKPGMTNGTMSNGTSDQGSMTRGSMTPGTTTGMDNGMSRGGTLPDASGQGGSGPHSDQGGTRVAPGTMK